MNTEKEGFEDGIRRVEDALRALPPDAPPAGFNQKICEALSELPPPRRPLIRRVRLFLERPAFVWGYRLATLVLLVGIFAGVWSLVGIRKRALVHEAAQNSGPTLASARQPDKGQPGTKVTFVLHAPQARSVAVVGTFNDWDPGRLPLKKRSDGTWETQVTLPPGQYEYQFVVDGTHFVPDPEATEQQDDGLGGANAVLRL
jgi:hypothetical protein